MSKTKIAIQGELGAYSHIAAKEFFKNLDVKTCLTFEEAFIPYKWDADWIPDKVDQMLDVLNSSSIPDENPYCELCAYNRELKNLL